MRDSDHYAKPQVANARQHALANDLHATPATRIIRSVLATPPVAQR